MAGDWIKLHRKLLESRVFSDPKVLKVWIWCLCRAGYKKQFYLGKDIESGSFVTGRFFGSDECGMKKSSHYLSLKKLEEWGMISQKPNNRFTVVSICNWTTYQLLDTEGLTTDEQQIDNKAKTNRKRIDTIEEGKEGKEDKEESFVFLGKTRKKNEYCDAFEEWWNVYPRGEAKKAAYEAWKKAGSDIKEKRSITSQEAVALMLERVKAYAASPRGSESDPSKIPLATTWLNQGRYDDNPTAWKTVLTDRPRPIAKDRVVEPPKGAVYAAETGDYVIPLDVRRRRELAE